MTQTSATGAISTTETAGGENSGEKISVFVTGGQTPIGRETVRQLVAAGHRVTATASTQAEADTLRKLGALPTYPDFSRMGEVRGALTIAKAQVIVNLAPQAANHTPHSPAHWNEKLAQETVALFKAAEAAGGVQFIVHTSYAFAGGQAPDDAGSLVKSAARAERVALNGNIPACVLRLGYLYGVGMAEMETLRDSLLAGRPLGAGSDVPAGWVYLTDAARAVVQAVEIRAAGQTLTVVDDQPTSAADFMTLFAERQGLTAPGRLPNFVQRLLTGKTQMALMDIPFTGSNAEARSVLNWQPRYATPRAGIDEMLLTWRAAGAPSAQPAATRRTDRRARGQAAETVDAKTEQAEVAAESTNTQQDIAKANEGNPAQVAQP